MMKRMGESRERKVQKSHAMHDSGIEVPGGCGNGVMLEMTCG